MFLMDYAFLPREDIKLNEYTFTWNDRIQPLLKSAEIKLHKEKEYWINRLKERRGKFSIALNECLARIKEFKTKDRVADAEMYIAELQQIAQNIEEYNKEVRNALESLLNLFIIIILFLCRKQ